MWALEWTRDIGDWTLIILDVARDNPAEARRIRRECTYRDVAESWVNSRRRIEGIGYTIGD